MTDLKTTTADGFKFDTKNENDLAFVSLRIALKAYFSTYQTFKYQLNIFDQENNSDQKAIDFSHSNSYCEACTETIVHFQHFAELVCKKLLRDDHPLLADVALNKPLLLQKLLHGKTLSDADQQTLGSITFSDTLERLSTLIDNKELKITTNSTLSKSTKKHLKNSIL